MSNQSQSTNVITGGGLAALLPSNNVKLLIDTDMLLYRACWATNEKPQEESIISFVGMMNAIIEELDSNDYVCYLSSRINIRHEVYPDYKANRKDAPKPVHIKFLREWIIENYETVEVEGLEADDLIADNMVIANPFDNTAGQRTVCVSQDKDLLQLEGWNYNFVDKKLVYVDRKSADFFFNCQLLAGDRVDNIPGLSEKRPKKGFGMATAAKALKGLDDNIARQEILALYTAKYGVEYGGYIMWINWYMLKVGSLKRVNVLRQLRDIRDTLTDEQFEELINQ